MRWRAPASSAISDRFASRLAGVRGRFFVETGFGPGDREHGFGGKIGESRDGHPDQAADRREPVPGDSGAPDIVELGLKGRLGKFYRQIGPPA